MGANFHYRVLIVDDEQLGPDLLQSWLSEQGFEVGIARDGLAALAQMHGALPDLIVSDLKMPNMSGFEFLSIVRRRFPQIPTIAVSGEFHPPLQPLGVIADAFLSKPFRLEEFMAKITDLLQQAPPRPAIKRDQAPVWVPRNGDYYVITCRECLRSFSIPAEKSVPRPRELRTMTCIFCGTLVRFIVEEAPEAAGLPVIESVEKRLAAILGTAISSGSATSAEPQRMSAATRAKIAAVARARWARVKAGRDTLTTP